jgi:hypothetical protein
MPFGTPFPQQEGDGTGAGAEMRCKPPPSSHTNRNERARVPGRGVRAPPCRSITASSSTKLRWTVNMQPGKVHLSPSHTCSWYGTTHSARTHGTAHAHMQEHNASKHPTEARSVQQNERGGVRIRLLWSRHVRRRHGECKQMCAPRKSGFDAHAQYATNAYQSVRPTQTTMGACTHRRPGPARWCPHASTPCQAWRGGPHQRVAWAVAGTAGSCAGCR